MKHVLYIIAMLAVGVWAYNLGTLNSSLSNHQLTTNTYLKQNDRGCDEILHNEVLNKPYCVVGMDREDEALYIIKLAGDKDEY